LHRKVFKGCKISSWCRQ